MSEQACSVRYDMSELVRNPPKKVDQYWQAAETITRAQVVEFGAAVCAATLDDIDNDNLFQRRQAVASSGHPQLIYDRWADMDIGPEAAISKNSEAISAIGPLNHSPELADWLLQSVPIQLRKFRSAQDINTAFDFLLDDEVFNPAFLARLDQVGGSVGAKLDFITDFSSLLQAAGIANMIRATDTSDLVIAGELFDRASEVRDQADEIGGSNESKTRIYKITKRQLDTDALKIHIAVQGGDLTVADADKLFTDLQIRNTLAFREAFNDRPQIFGLHFEWALVLVHNLLTHANRSYGETAAWGALDYQECTTQGMNGKNPFRRHRIDVEMLEKQKLGFVQCKTRDYKHPDWKEPTGKERKYVLPIHIARLVDSTGRDLNPEFAEMRKDESEQDWLERVTLEYYREFDNLARSLIDHFTYGDTTQSLETALRVEALLDRITFIQPRAA